TDATGFFTLGNDVGIDLVSPAHDNTVGAGNLIVGSSDVGVEVNGAGAGNTIVGNQIGPDTDGQPFTGANTVGIRVVNGSQGTTIDVQGNLAAANDLTYTLEFFRSPGCDGSGAGEGAVFLGSSSQTTNGTGTVSFDVTVPAAGNGQIITATATDPTGNTSAFS